MLLAELDKGEAAVIHTARKRGITRVLIDERKARRVAELVYGLRVKGSAAMLVEAKHRGIFQPCGQRSKPCGLVDTFLGPNLMRECLRRAGEAQI